MFNATLYNEYNQLQTRDAEEIIRKFNEICADESNETSSLIDIGTGCGGVLSQVVVPRIKRNFVKVLGVDISKNMIEFAQRKYENEFTEFRCLDVLSGAVKLPPVDIVTSFYCLQFVSNLRQAFANIHNLLKPNGMFVCSMLKAHVIFDAYVECAKNNKFSEYMQDYKKVLPAIYQDTNPDLGMRKMLEGLGFEVLYLKHKHDVFDYETRSNFINAMKSVNPFIPRMPESLHDELMNFMADFVEETSNHFEAKYEIIYFIVRKLGKNSHKANLIL